MAALTLESESCMSCQLANIPCYEKGRPCLNCLSFGVSDSCIDNPSPPKKTKVEEKKGSRPHVPSACVNCKVAHLACDISRPCKRCVSLDKTDSCQDVIHKKRGRPKRRNQNSFENNDYTYDFIYGTIETPVIISSETNKPKQKKQKPISFVHESFQANSSDQKQKASTMTGSDNSFLETSKGHDVLNQPPRETFLSTTQEQNLLQDIMPNSNDFLTDLFDTSLLEDSTFASTEQHELTLILSMEICCAKIPTEIYTLWGYHPQELAHRSLYDFISPNDTDRLSQLHRQLLDHTAQTTNQNKPLPPAERSTSSLFSTTDTCRLKSMANGSKVYTDTIHIKMSSGKFKAQDISLFIGGGLGGDLYDPNTLDKHYIVANFRQSPFSVEHLIAPVTPPLDLTSTGDWITRQPTLPNQFLGHKSPTPKQFTMPKFNIAPMSSSSSSSTSAFSKQAQFNPLFHLSSSQVTHPTQKYFLQTSSSTLNAAASAVKSQSVFSMSGSSNRDVDERKVEMSIHSLLC